VALAIITMTAQRGQHHIVLSINGWMVLRA
jgi:hypothetical protein